MLSNAAFLNGNAASQAASLPKFWGTVRRADNLLRFLLATERHYRQSARAIAGSGRDFSGMDYRHALQWPRSRISVTSPTLPLSR